MTNGHCAGGCFPFERVNQIIDNRLAVVVKGLASTEMLHVSEILRRACGDDFVACSHGELNRVAADTCRAAPDEESFSGRLWTRHGRVLEVELVFLEQTAGCCG